MNETVEGIIENQALQKNIFLDDIMVIIDDIILKYRNIKVTDSFILTFAYLTEQGLTSSEF